jgi:hypothetical protein
VTVHHLPDCHDTPWASPWPDVQGPILFSRQWSRRHDAYHVRLRQPLHLDGQPGHVTAVFTIGAAAYQDSPAAHSIDLLLAMGEHHFRPWAWPDRNPMPHLTPFPWLDRAEAWLSTPLDWWRVRRLRREWRQAYTHGTPTPEALTP